jgi:hypothetical protein
MSPDKAKIKKVTRRINLVMWSAMGFLLLGYLPTAYLHSPKVSMVVAAMAVIPYGMKIARPVWAGVVSGLLGAATGAAAANALSAGLAPHAVMSAWLQYIAATGGFCAAIGALFGYLAHQRHRQTEEEWKSGNDE